MNQADIGYLFFNVFVFGVVFGWAVLSYQSISSAVAWQRRPDSLAPLPATKAE